MSFHDRIAHSFRMPSAESSDLFGHDEMRLTRTAIRGLDPCCQCVGPPQPGRLRAGPLALAPLRFERVAPRTCAGPGADDAAPARAPPLALLIRVASPGLPGPATVPGGVVPAQPQRGA